MINFLLPPPDDTKISVKASDGSSVEIEVIDVVETFKLVREEADKLGTEDWLSLFVRSMQKYNLQLDRTSSVLLIEVAVSELAKIKKSSSPEVEQ